MLSYTSGWGKAQHLIEQRQGWRARAQQAAGNELGQILQLQPPGRCCIPHEVGCRVVHVLMGQAAGAYVQLGAG